MAVSVEDCEDVSAGAVQGAYEYLESNAQWEGCDYGLGERRSPIRAETEDGRVPSSCFVSTRIPNNANDRLVRFGRSAIRRIQRIGRWLDNSHIRDALFEGDGNGCAFEDGAGECVAWSVYWSAVGKVSVAMPEPEKSRPSSMKRRVGRSVGALKGISISMRPLVPKK